jgi:hypothetical protein
MSLNAGNQLVPLARLRLAWIAITLVLTSLTGGTSSPLWRVFLRRSKRAARLARTGGTAVVGAVLVP